MYNNVRSHGNPNLFFQLDVFLHFTVYRISIISSCPAVGKEVFNSVTCPLRSLPHVEFRNSVVFLKGELPAGVLLPHSGVWGGNKYCVVGWSILLATRRLDQFQWLEGYWGGGGRHLVPLLEVF